ncbi:MAG: hypothetical protein ACPGUC_11440, partial [Gammaproteobacteria bacterium]
HAEAVEKGTPVKSHFVSQKGRVADALLAVTDAKAKNAEKRLGIPKLPDGTLPDHAVPPELRK